MPYYESVFIARPDISSAQVEALTEGFKNLIGENGGQVTKTEYWGLKTLTYRLKKNRKGHYSLMNLEAPAAAVKEMERTMQLNEDVIRFMTIRVDELEEGPSAMLRNRSARDDRGRGRRDDRPQRDDRPRREERPREEAASGEASAEGESKGDRE